MTDHPTTQRLNILISPGFLLGLSLLLLNDFVFKPHSHNALTGKLSDFAGLFVLPLFFVAFYPHSRRLIHVLAGAFFIVWKSSYSQPLINGWNYLSIVTVTRTVDYSDYWALLVLPLSYIYSVTYIIVREVARSTVYLIALISIVAFTATSFSTKTAYDNEYTFAVSKHELLERMSKLPTHEVNRTFPLWDADELEVTFDSCTGRATISVNETNARTTIVKLKEIDYRCPQPPGKQEMQDYFEREFINKLRETPVTKSPQVDYIWGIRKEKSPEPTGKPKSGSPPAKRSNG